MGNKPHRIKKTQKKAVRRASQGDLSKDNPRTPQEITFSLALEPFNKERVRKTLLTFKKDIEHKVFKDHLHPSNGATKGFFEHQETKIMNAKVYEDKKLKKWNLGGQQKSSERARKDLKQQWKKAS